MLLSGAMLLPACAHTDGQSASLNQEDADEISQRCGSPKPWLLVDRYGYVNFEAPLGAEIDFDATRCLLKELRDAGVTKLGFVGIEKLPVDDE